MTELPSPRADYITSLERIELKEAVPGLIHIVETELDYHGARAAGVLKRYRDARALPALRKALPAHLKSRWQRDVFIAAIIACGGLSLGDAVHAIEAYARRAATPDGLRDVRSVIGPGGEMSPELALGIHLAHTGSRDDAIVAAVIARVGSLRKTEPNVARRMEAPLFSWQGQAAHRFVVSRLADATIDDSLLRRALYERHALRATCGRELRAMLSRTGAAAGVAAAVLEDRGSLTRVLRSGNAAAILKLLHATMVSDSRTLDETEDWAIIGHDAIDRPIQLPIEMIGPLLASRGGAVAQAARSWLEHEGGPAAEAWLQGTPDAPVALPASQLWRVDGIALGMSRAEVDARAAEPGKASPQVQFSAAGRVVLVSGASLGDGQHEMIAPSAKAGDVRRLFGRPDDESVGHVVSTVGGFAWRYRRDGAVLVFSFVDDHFCLGRSAPLHKVTLRDGDAASSAP